MAYLGFNLNFHKGVLEVPNEKLKTVRRELGKLVTHTNMTPRKMSAILGVVRSFLMAIPHLRAFTDLMVQFVARGQVGGRGWDSPHPILAELTDQVREIKDLLASGYGRPFEK